MVDLCTTCLEHTQNALVYCKFNFSIRAQETPQTCTNMIELAFQHRCQGMQALYGFEGLCCRDAANQVITTGTELDVPGKLTKARCFHSGIGYDACQGDTHLIDALF